jgi:hypothetical protein
MREYNVQEILDGCKWVLLAGFEMNVGLPAAEAAIPGRADAQRSPEDRASQSRAGEWRFRVDPDDAGSGSSGGSRTSHAARLPGNQWEGHLQHRVFLRAGRAITIPLDFEKIDLYHTTVWGISMYLTL